MLQYRLGISYIGHNESPLRALVISATASVIGCKSPTRPAILRRCSTRVKERHVEHVHEIMEQQHSNPDHQDESIEDEPVSFVNIDELQNHGVNAGDIKKLKVLLFLIHGSDV